MRCQPLSLLATPVLVVTILGVGSCIPSQMPPPQGEGLTDEAAARQVLIDFFEYLHDSNYATAADLYGGSYETLIDQNPTIDPDDRPALFRGGCTINGAQCLEIRSARVDSTGSGADGRYTFIVEFNEPDGSRFSLGPCCGDDTDDMEPITEFRFEVRKTSDRRFKVLTPPIYLP
jgi:hypothetical protein